MALTLLSDAWTRARNGGGITALTVDHGLRAESRSEAEQVARWMQPRSIAHHILTPHHRDMSRNLQESARRWRYDALAEYCRAHGILHCLLAHHAGDQRETVAHNIARGETADGASGMARARNYRGVRFLRPLLSIEKEALTKYLQVHAVDWIEDPSNTNTDFARVRIRQALADNPAQRAELDRTLVEQAPARAARDQAQAAIAARCVIIHPQGTAEIDHAQWLALEPTAASGLLADVLTTIGEATHRPRKADTARLATDLRKPPMKRRTLHGCEIVLDQGRIRIAREKARLDPSHAGFAPPKPLAAAAFWWLK